MTDLGCFLMLTVPILFTIGMFALESWEERQEYRKHIIDMAIEYPNKDHDYLNRFPNRAVKRNWNAYKEKQRQALKLLGENER